MHLLTALYTAPIVLGLWLFATNQSWRIRWLGTASFIVAACGVVLLLPGNSGVTIALALVIRGTLEKVEVSGGQHEYRHRPALDLPWRASNSPWVEVQRLIAKHTPTDAYFITPPILEGFRTHSRRSEFVDWKQGTLSLFHERFGMEWLRRLARLMSGGGRLNYIDIYNRYNSLAPADYQSLAAEFGLTHAVTMKPVPDLTLLHRNQVFFVYQLR